MDLGIANLAADQLYWTKLAAIGQLAGAIATFAAVVVSLTIAVFSGKPRLKIGAKDWLQIGESREQDVSLLIVHVANTGDRTVLVKSIGWTTGWFRIGPKWLRHKHAVQMFNSVPGTAAPPFELQPGLESSSAVEMNHIIQHCEERQEPLFSRDYPILGRRSTKVVAFVHLAGGNVFKCRLARSTVLELVEAERRAKV